VLVPEALLAAEATALAGGGAPRLDAPVDRALASVLRAELEREVRAAGIPRERIERYYREQRRHFSRPASILVWRILLSNEAAARELITSLGEPSLATWRALARERSLDEATSMRGGSLGYVAADGQTHHPQVRVDPALHRAASRVGDGQLVPHPVAEGRYHAVVWRRASRPEHTTPLAEAEGEITELLLEAELLRRELRLLSELRETGLRDHHPALLDDFAAAENETPAAPTRSGPPAAVPSQPRLRPRPGDRGMR
jgi:peptidyl-prolyl cis-trans isomerase C